MSLYNLHFIDSYRAILGKQTIKTTTKMIFFNYYYFYFFVTIFISFLHVHVIVTKHSYNIRRKKKEKRSPPAKGKKIINRRVIRVL